MDGSQAHPLSHISHDLYILSNFIGNFLMEGVTGHVFEVIRIRVERSSELMSDSKSAPFKTLQTICHTIMLL